MLILRLAFLTLSLLCYCYCYSHPDDEKLPSLGITILVRNKALSLPHFLTHLRSQKYPKNRIYIWFLSDHNDDRSLEIIEEFVKVDGGQYAEIIVTANTDEKLHSDETVSTHWSPKRYKHVSALREKGLEFARRRNYDYHFMLDADVFLTDPNSISTLINKNKTIVAPLLSTDGVYANFWCEMTENNYYKWSEDYDKIRKRDLVGCIPVRMVHSAVLVKIKRKQSDYLVYEKNKMFEYEGPEDDIITFAVSADRYSVDMFICNDLRYGFIPIPLADGEDPAFEAEQLLNTKMAALANGIQIKVTDYLKPFVVYPKTSKLGMDQIYMINLERRVERRELMMQSFKELGLDVQIVPGVDGQKLSIRMLPKGIKLMPGYEDPFHRRPMKAGEVGCFLSHFKIWQDVVMNGHAHVLILEDDVYFRSYFKLNFIQLQLEMSELPDWDLMYIGRKILNADSEVAVSEHIVSPKYSYWTLGYMLSLEGATKLIAADPLTKMLPVDEFLPIMFDQHPNDTWKSFFPVRNVNAYSAEPLLIEPTRYTGQEGYISDTEDSPVLRPAPSPLDHKALRYDL